jgi:hypothetical protein
MIHKFTMDAWLDRCSNLTSPFTLIKLARPLKK